MKRKTTTAVRPTSQGCSTLELVPAWQGDGDGDRGGFRQTQSCRGQDPLSHGTRSPLCQARHPGTQDTRGH